MIFVNLVTGTLLVFKKSFFHISLFDCILAYLIVGFSNYTPKKGRFFAFLFYCLGTFVASLNLCLPCNSPRTYKELR